MRSTSILCLGFVAAVLTGCTDLDDPPVWVEFDYQVRCEDCEPMAPNDDPHMIGALDGDDGLEVGCKAEKGRINLAVRFDAEDDDENWSFELTGADVSEDGPGNGCFVEVAEGPNSYRGACTGDEPTDETPCRVDLTHDDYLVSGEIICEHIPNRNAKNITRYVTKPGTGVKPIKFEVQNCEGL